MGFTLGAASKVKRFFSSRPTKEKSSSDCKNTVVVGYGVADSGSKDENFFDSRVWLDSDFEDDYYSVNGDFTPSRGSTPNRHFGTKPFSVDTFSESQSEPSPTDKKKLADLLQVSLNEPENNEFNSSANKTDGIGKLSSKTEVEDPETSQTQTSSEGTPKPKKERLGLGASCCLPGFIPGISSRKKKSSPTL